jgi:MFS family permease
VSNVQREASVADAGLRRNLQICTWEGMVALPLVFLSLPANFIIAALLTRNFGLSEGWYGLIASLPALSSVVQLALIPLLSRWLHPKALTLTAAWVHLGCWLIFVLALPYLGFESAALTGLVFLAFFLVSSLLAAVVGVSWTSWIQEWIPGKVRGKYFGNRNRLITMGTVAFLLASGKLLGFFESSIFGYQLLLLVAILLRGISILGQHRILSSDTGARHVEKYRWRDYPAILRHSPGLLTFILFGCAFGFATSLIGPFYTIFMYELLGLSITHVSWLIILASVGGALSFPAWGKLLDKHGNKPVIIVCLSLWQAQNYLWCILTPDTSWLLYPMWLWGGVTSAGYILGSFNLLLKVMPRKAKTTGISIYLAITSLVAAIAPILGGQFFTWAAAAEFSPLRTYQVSFLIQPTLCLLAVLILLRIHEPQSDKVRTVVGAMRSMRQIGAIFGLSFLVNYTFFKPRKPVKPKSTPPSSSAPEPQSPEKHPPAPEDQ